MAVLVNGDRGLVAVCDRPDDVFRAKRRIATEKHTCAGGLEGDRVDDRYIPLVELDADIPFHEGKGILLADREDYVVAGQDDPVEFGRLQPAVLVFVPLDYRKLHAGQLALFDNHPQRRMVQQQFDLLFLGIFELPVGRLEQVSRLTRGNHDPFTAQPQ
ncbi:hypothetical protein MnTg04_00285 [bacterium MnTg04]|nr:hypothetical protein MnTg04_00285 [bacterium MnTg04]